MRLADYLSRIGYDGPLRADVETLTGVHHAHLLAIPYENIDVALRRPVSRDASAAFDKLVSRRRGGWCYEMNGLLGWALEEIGFRVTPLAGGVNRETMGDDRVGNHLLLRVDLDRPYIADAGFGDGLIDPVPLAEGEYVQRDFSFRLEKLDARWWRFHNHAHGAAPSFDFVNEPADTNLLESKCRWLQQDASPFVTNVIVQKHTAHGIAAMRDRTLRIVTPGGVESRAIADGGEYERVLRDVFDLVTPDAPTLWRKIEAAPA